MEPFYYTKMTKQQQAAYHVIMQGANALADEFQIPRIESAELYDVFFRLRLDHPENLRMIQPELKENIV